MGRFTKSNSDLGDVHAPIEDTNVPVPLKLLVAFMVISLAGMAAIIVYRLKLF